MAAILQGGQLTPWLLLSLGTHCSRTARWVPPGCAHLYAMNVPLAVPIFTPWLCPWMCPSSRHGCAHLYVMAVPLTVPIFMPGL